LKHTKHQEKTTLNLLFFFKMTDKIPIFSNFGKPTNDFFTKGFPRTHKLELSTKAENGLTLISSAEQKERKDGTQYILGKVEAKYKCSCDSSKEGDSSKTVFEATESVDTDNVIKGDYSLTTSALPGFKFILKPQTGSSHEVTGGFEYQNHNVSASTSLLYKLAGDLAFTGTLVGGIKGCNFGVESVYSFSRASDSKVPKGLDSVKGLFNYKTPTLDGSFYVKEQWNLESDKKEQNESKPAPTSKITVGGYYEHKPTEFVSLHSLLEADLNKTVSESVSCTFGGSYKVDSETTTQAKFNTDGKLTLHVRKDLTSHLSTTLTSEFNTFNLGGNEHKVAVGVIYKA